jgi:hypothetical protein
MLVGDTTNQVTSRRTVDLHLAVRNHGLDLALFLQVLQAPSCQGTVDLESVDEGGYCDEAIRLDIFVELLRGGLVQQDSVLGLVLDWTKEELLATRSDMRFLGQVKGRG